MTKYAPILLFVYNRPEHLKQTMETLQNNTLAAESELYIYSDAARKDTDEAAVAEVRNYIHKITGFKSITLIEREKNWGLARNIIDGVTTQVNRFGRVIVMEDDLITAPYFLQFMNDALETYKDEPRVGHIQACDFTNDIQYGEIYAVVLDTIRTIKILRRSPDPDKLRFIPINTNDYDEQEFDKSRIINVFEVIGSISKFF